MADTWYFDKKENCNDVAAIAASIYCTAHMVVDQLDREGKLDLELLEGMRGGVQGIAEYLPPAIRSKFLDCIAKATEYAEKDSRSGAWFIAAVPKFRERLGMAGDVCWEIPKELGLTPEQCLTMPTRELGDKIEELRELFRSKYGEQVRYLQDESAALVLEAPCKCRELEKANKRL